MASGEDRVVDQEAEALTHAGHVVRHFERCSDEIAGLSLGRRALVPFQAVWSRRAADSLTEVVDRFRPDVVHVHNVLPLLSSSVLPSTKRCEVPCVVTFHHYQQVCLSGTLFRAGTDCRQCVGRALPLPGVWHGCYRRSPAASAPLAVAAAVARQHWLTVPSAYIFLSEAQRRLLEVLGLPPPRCFVKFNMAPPSSGSEERENLVAYLGRLAELKGLRTLMQAWDAYLGAGPPAGLRLVIAGAGPLEGEIRDWARTRPSVEMAGVLSASASACLLRRATTVVVPSEWQEPFGLVVAEAMAAGVAPIATARGALQELITPGVDGLLYPPGDARSLAAMLRRIEAAPQWARRLGAAARSTYDRRFAPHRIVAQLEAIYGFAAEHPRWLGTGELGPAPASDGPPLPPSRIPAEVRG